MATSPSPEEGKEGFFDRRAIIPADNDFNRWRVVPPAVATHVCIGAVYSWSLFNEPLTRVLGVVAPASSDWTLATVVPVFSVSIGVAGLTAALSGAWAERNGPRTAVFAAGALWGGGLLLSSLAVQMHSTPLLYLGFGVLGGLGIGLAYGPPVATLLRWFPDRRGLASGMAIMGFGAGALLAAPAIRAVQAAYFRSPTFLGSEAAVTTAFEAGQRIAVDAGGVPVVVASTRELASLGLPPDRLADLAEGVYVVGTGANGVAEALAALGLTYGAVMMAAATLYRVPREGWTPAGYVPVSSSSSASAAVTGKPSASSSGIAIPPGTYVDVATASRTPTFARIWTSLFLNATAGISVLGVAKTLMSDVFGASLPMVDAAFCAGYVAALSAFNGVGRLAWAAASDKLGRKATYTAFFALGVPLYLSVPFAAHWAGADPSVVPLVMFTSATLGIVSMYGGGFAVAPAYLADAFGAKEVGAIYGRLLTAWSAAGLVGPTLLAMLRRSAEVDAIKALAATADAGAFQAKFGVPVAQLDSLISANAVNIPKLMAVVPAGTPDPTPMLYDTTMVTLAAMLGVGFVNNLLTKPVDPKFLSKMPEGGGGGGDGGGH